MVTVKILLPAPDIAGVGVATSVVPELYRMAVASDTVDATPLTVTVRIRLSAFSA